MGEALDRLAGRPDRHACDLRERAHVTLRRVEGWQARPPTNEERLEVLAGALALHDQIDCRPSIPDDAPTLEKLPAIDDD